MEHHQDNDVSARASNELPNEQLGLWVIQMHYWELQPVGNQSHSEESWVVTLEYPFLHECSLSGGLRCPPAQDQCPEPSFPLPFQKLLAQLTEAQENMIFKHLKSNRQIKPPSILMIWAQNGVQFMIFVPRLCFPSAAASAVLFYPSTFTINIIIIPSPR